MEADHPFEAVQKAIKTLRAEADKLAAHTDDNETVEMVFELSAARIYGAAEALSTMLSNEGLWELAAPQSETGSSTPPTPEASL